MLRLARLPSRGCVRVAGPGAGVLLQGVVTQQLAWTRDELTKHDEGLKLKKNVPAGRVRTAALLSARGRVIADVLVHERTRPQELNEKSEDSNSATAPGSSFSSASKRSGRSTVRDDEDGLLGSDFILECDMRAAPGIAAMLRSLRVHEGGVKIGEVTQQLAVWALWHSDGAAAISAESAGAVALGGVWRRDPRSSQLGWRCLVPRHIYQDPKSIPKELLSQPSISLASEEGYNVHRMLAGVPQGVDELIPEKALPFESNLDVMNAVSLEKGCYVGQELTARTFHTGVTRKRILPFRSDTTIPFGTDLRVDSKPVGIVLSCDPSGLGMAMVRLDSLPGTTIRGVALSAELPNGQTHTLSLIEPTWWEEVSKLRA